MYPLQVAGSQRELLMARLDAQRIQTRPLWHLNHQQKPYAHCQSYRIERAMHLWETTLTLPCSVNLTEAVIERVVAALRQP